METYFGEIEQAHSSLARGRALADLKRLTQDVEDLLKATAHDMSNKAKEAHSRIATALKRANSTIGELQAQGVASLKVTAKQTDEVIHNHPYRFVGLAFGAGLLVGLLAMRNNQSELEEIEKP